MSDIVDRTLYDNEKHIGNFCRAIYDERNGPIITTNEEGV